MKKYIFNGTSYDLMAECKGVTSLPTPSATFLNGCYLLTETQENYEKGKFYKCEAQGTSPETYAWEQI